MFRTVLRVSLAFLLLFLLGLSPLLAGLAGAEEEQPPRSIPAGLNLTVTGMPETARPLDVMVLESGEWWLRQQLDDRPMYLESRRLPAAEFDEAAARRLIAMEWPLAREIRVEPFPGLAERLSYPALKAEFLTGENEDTDQFAAAMVFADEWSFWFVLEADADAETHDETLEQEMESILLGIDVVNPENGDFLPGPGLPVHGSGAALPDSPTTMDALIRVKKVVAPEEGLEGKLAYRNDGLGEFAGRPVLLLVFGGDSPEKFTAERYFAVDAEGAVYEWDPAAGDAEYQRVDADADGDEELPMWVGLFRKDGMELEIGMYRKGPMGFYFGGLFSGEGIEDRQVLAAVDGRTASGEHLSFVLDDDDSAITVSVNEGADEALQQLAGRYVESDEEDGDTEDSEDNGEPVARKFPLVNKLGFTIAFLRTGAHGSEPFATNVADGATVMLDKETWRELWRSTRLIVKNAEDENDSAPPLQFARDFSKEVDSFALVLQDGVPALRFFEDGRQVDEAPAGLPLEELLYGMELGMEPGSYADHMTPLAADGWESFPFAVRTGTTSWRLLPPGPVFTEDRDGKKRLSSISFGRDNRRIDITMHNDGAFDGHWHHGAWLAAKTAEEGKGLPERYILNDDGTFVHASSDFAALEQERELFKSGTWFVTDNELRLDVRERWSLPVGGVENIVQSGAVIVVDGVVRKVSAPPETDILPIAQAAKDTETGREAITIDGATFYKFDDQADADVDFLKRYNELRRAQKFDFSGLKDVVFTYASGAGAWRTNLTIQPDGTFNGQYSDADMGSRGDGYPHGTVYICDFSGVFSSLEKVDEAGYAYTLKCEKLSQEGVPEEEQIIDGVRYVNAEPYGLENAGGENACTLYLPGTPYDQMPESFFEDRGIELEDVETPVLASYVLRIPSDGSEDSYDEYFYGAVDDSDYRFYYIYWTGGEG